MFGADEFCILELHFFSSPPLQRPNRSAKKDCFIRQQKLNSALPLHFSLRLRPAALAPSVAFPVIPYITLQFLSLHVLLRALFVK